MHVVEFNYSACRRRGRVLNSPHFCFFLIIFILLNLERTTNSCFKQHKTLSNLPFQCFIPISAFYSHFSVLSPFQRFIPISAFYPHFSVLSPFQRFIPISAFYPHFSVLSPFQRFIPLSVSVFSFRFRHSVSAFYPDPTCSSCYVESSIFSIRGDTSILKVIIIFVSNQFSINISEIVLVCFALTSAYI